MKWKTVTIFISSTFDDMHAERDYLVKNVFPDLREWCEERKIHLVDVDLRWGVTKEDSNSNNTVLACLKNIDISRPFFLCFLAQRRGWVPTIDDLSYNTAREYPEIYQRVKNVSMTELEVEHALLDPLYRLVNNEERYSSIAEHSIFFFRKDDNDKELNHESCFH